jgi:hypothetical protein
MSTSSFLIPDINNNKNLTSVYVPSLSTISTVTYNGSYYIAAGNTLAKSTDTITWDFTPTSISGMSSISNFAWNRPYEGVSSIKPLTIACGEGSNTLAYSNDGIYWKGLGKNIFNTRANKAVWNGTLWVAVGTGNFWTAYSYDGIAWYGSDKILLTEGYDIAWNGTVFVAAGYGNTTPLVASTDGINWYNIPSSSFVFSNYASSVQWTSKIWIAYGSGGNTTAYSSSTDAWLWTATTTPNLAVTDVSSVLYQIGYPQTDNSGYITSSSYTTNYSAYKAFDNSMSRISSTEWRSAANTYDASSGINKGVSQSITYNNTLTVSGEWLQINAQSPVVIQYYHLSFYLDTSYSYFSIPKEWYLLGSNDQNSWNLIDYNSFNYTFVPSSTTQLVNGNTVSNNKLISYYRFETADTSGTLLANYASTTAVYDASLSVSNLITSSTYKVDSASLSLSSTFMSALTASGQYVTVSSIPTTDPSNITISFWGKVNPGYIGYNPFFSISNGSGNNTLEFGTLGGLLTLNNTSGGSNVGVPNFSVYSTPWGTSTPTTYTGMAISADGTKAVFASYNTGYLYFSTFDGTSWTPLNTTMAANFGASRLFNISLTADGMRGAVCTNGSGYVYTFTWNGSNYSAATQTADTTARNYWVMDMTADGNRIVLGGNTYVFYANWNGTTYGNAIQTLDTTVRSCQALAVTADGSRIVYADTNNNFAYLATWNGSNYTNGVQINTTAFPNTIRSVRFSPDANIIYQSTANAPVYFSVWNGSSYNSTFTPISSAILPYTDSWGLCVDGTGNLYFGNYSSSTIYKTNVSNSGAPIFASYGTPFGTSVPSGCAGMGLSQDGSKLVFSNYGGNIYYATYNTTNATWSSLATTLAGTANYVGIALNSNGTRGAVAVRSGYIYYFTWNGTNYTTLTQTLDTTTRGYNGLDMTPDGNMIVVVASYVYFATWNGSNYSTFTQTLDSTSASYYGISISSDGNKIAYSDNAYLYYAVWNGTNFSNRIQISTTSIANRCVRFSSDSKTIYYSSYSNATASLYYTVWNGTSYNPIMNPISTVAIPASLEGYGLIVDASGYIYLCGYNTTTIYKTFALTTAPNFTAYTTPFGTSNPINVGGMAFSRDGLKFVFSNYAGNIYYSTYNTTNSTWSSLATTLAGTANYVGIALNTDGSRGVVSVRNGLVYYFTWNGSNYTSLTQTLDTTTRGYNGIDMTPNGNTIVVAATYIYYATWNGNNYSTFTQTLDTSGNGYVGITISNDGSKIAYSDSSYLYYATWNGSNYSTPIKLTTMSIAARQLKFSPDNTILYYSSTGNSTASVYYTTWNGNSYNSALIPIPTNFIPASLDCWGLAVDSSGSLYAAGYNSSTIYKTNVSFYNTSQLINFYPQQVNDGVWRNYVLSLSNNGNYINNCNYQLYLNGSLIYNASAGLFPTSMSRKSNFIGKSNNLQYAYLNGGIDDFRIYNRSFTSSYINSLYGSLYNYYRFETSDICGNSLANYYTTNTQLLDASFMNISSVGFVAGYISTSSPGTLIASGVTDARNIMIDNGCILAGASMSTLYYQALGVRSFFTTPSASRADWILCIYDGSTYLKMCYVVVNISSGNAYAYQSAAGYFAATAPVLTQTLINYAWSLNTTATAGSGGYGVYSMYVKLINSASSMITNSSYKVDSGSLALSSTVITASGQYININNIPSTNANGLSISFWASVNSGYIGYSPFFSFGNGKSNDSIEFGSYGGYLTLSMNVGKSTQAPTFTSSTTPWGTSTPTQYTGMAISADGTRAVFCSYNSGYMYYSTYNGSSWTSLTQTLAASPGINRYIGIALSADGNLGVVILNTSYVYTFTWTGSNYSTLTQTADTNARNWQGVDMTADGSRIVLTTNTNVYYANWNGTTYNTAVTTLETNSRNYVGISITPDGSRIAYGVDTDGSIYIAVWNGSNYSIGLSIGTTVRARAGRFSPDGNIFYLANYSAAIYYSVWNGYTYSTPVAISTSVFPALDDWGMCVGADGSVYLASQNSTTIYKSTPSFTTYVYNNNIYPGTVNDGVWRHYALNFEPNGTYTIYINGIEAYVSPKASTLYQNTVNRLSNFIGKSNNHPLSFFNGNIDDFFIFNRTFNNSNVSSFYRFETTDVSGSTLANYKSTYTPFYDATIFNLTSIGYISGYISNTSPGTLIQSNVSDATSIVITMGSIMGGTSLNSGSPFYCFPFRSTSTTATASQADWIMACNANGYTAMVYLRININNNNAYIYAVSAGSNIPIPLTQTTVNRIWNNATSTTVATSGSASGFGINGLYVKINSSPSSLISTSSYKVDSSALSLSTSTLLENGQYIQFTAAATHSSAISFAFWARISSGIIGYNPIFSIGNQMGNNVLEFASISGLLTLNSISGAVVGTPSFSNYTTPWTSTLNSFIGMAVSLDGTKAVFCSLNNPNIYFSTYNSSNSTWSSPTTSNVSNPATNNYGISLNADGTRGVVISGTGLIYFFTWDGSNYSNITATLDTTSRTYYGIDMTPDGKRIVLATSTYIYYADWNGTNYGTCIQTLDTNSRTYMGIGITYDGSRIVYSINSSGSDLYYAAWNGSNYNNGTLIPCSSGGNGRIVRFSPDGNTLYFTSYGGTYYYTQWNGFSYNSTLGTIPSSALPSTGDGWGLCVDGYGSIYLSYGTTSIYKTNVTFTNVTQLSNFYTTRVNDNVWRHYVLTLNSYGQFQLYINNSLVYTYTNFIYPTSIVRTNSFIGKSNNHPLAYFNGGIDNFYIFNKFLSTTDISGIYNAISTSSLTYSSDVCSLYNTNSYTSNISSTLSEVSNLYNTIISSVPVFNQQTLTITDTTQFPYIVKLKNLSSNQYTFQYYRFVFPSIFQSSTLSYTRVSECDLYIANPNTYKLNRFIKPIITKTHILHPISIIPFSTQNGKQLMHMITDLYGNIVQNYSINNGYLNSGLIYGANTNIISSYCFDGQYLITTPIDGGNIYYINNNSLNTSLKFDISLNGTKFNTNINGNVYSSCYNGQRIILAGTGGNVITYSAPLSITPTTTFYPSLNANSLFTTVYNVSSNPGYGFVYTPNRIYFNPGDKLSVVAPKSYNKNISNTSTISVNMNSASIVQNIILPTTSVIRGLLGPTGPRGVGHGGAFGSTGYIGPTGCTGPTGFSFPGSTAQSGCTGITGYTGKTGSLGPIGLSGVTGLRGTTGTTGYTGFTGSRGTFGYTGPLNCQSWVVNNDNSIYTNGNILINTITSTSSIDISGNLHVSNSIIGRNSLYAQNISVQNKFIINSNTFSNHNFDVSGNSIFRNILSINNYTPNSIFGLDISGSLRTHTLYSNIIQKFIHIPSIIDVSYITVDYNQGDSFYINIGNIVTQNFSCIIENLPLSKLPYTSFNVILYNDYTTTTIDHFYCNNIIIQGNSYTPNFNGGNPVSVYDMNMTTNLYIQKFSIICLNSNIWKVFCESIKYSI